MRNKILILIIILFLTPNVIANSISDRAGVLTNYTLIFANLNRSTIYFTLTDPKGDFILPKSGLTPETTPNLLQLSICKNIENMTINRAYTIEFLNNIKLKCVSGLKFYFYGIIKTSNLEILINKDLSEYATGEKLTGYCRSQNLYCSVTLTKNGDFNETGEFYSNFSNKSIAFTFNFSELGEGENIFTLFQTNGTKSTLNVLWMLTQKIEVTNPYPEEKRAVLRTNEPYCSFSNGTKEITEKFKSNETKEFITISKEIGKSCTINNNFINVNIRDISVFSLSWIDISVISIVGLGVCIYLFKKRKK